MAGMVPGWIPGGVVWVYITGVLLMATCLALLVKKWVTPAMIVLAVMLVLFILTIHIPGMTDPQTMQKAMSSLLKDLALTGAALVFIDRFGTSSE